MALNLTVQIKQV